MMGEEEEELVGLAVGVHVHKIFNFNLPKP